MDAIHAAIRGLSTTAPQNLPQAITSIAESIYQLPEAAAASGLFTLLSSPVLSSQPADLLDPAISRAVLAGLDKLCRRYRTLPVSCPGLLQFLSSSSDARVFRIADRTLSALFTSVAASLPAWDAAAIITNPMPVIAWKSFLRLLRRAVEALVPSLQSSPPLSSPLLACPNPTLAVQPSATPAATVSAILQLLETTILTLSPNPLKGSGPETAQFCQFLRSEGRGEESSVSLDIMSGRTAPSLPYAGPAPSCCLNDENWLSDATAVDPVLLLRLASALSIQLASLLQDNPTTRGRAQGIVVSAPYTAATYSDLLARVATIGYYRPWFAEPIINAVLDYAVKPPLHCCVTVGTSVMLQPELHTSIRSALSQLCASPACGAYGASCNGVLARMGLPHVPFSPFLLIPPLPSFLEPHLASPPPLSSAALSTPLHTSPPDRVTTLEELYLSLQGPPIPASNQYTTAFVAASALNTQSMGELVIMNLRHLPLPSDAEYAQMQASLGMRQTPMNKLEALVAALVEVQQRIDAAANMSVEEKGGEGRGEERREEDVIDDPMGGTETEIPVIETEPQATVTPFERTGLRGNIWSHPSVSKWRDTLSSPLSSSGGNDCMDRLTRGIQATWIAEGKPSDDKYKEFTRMVGDIDPDSMYIPDWLAAVTHLLWEHTHRGEGGTAPAHIILTHIVDSAAAAAQVSSDVSSRVRIVANRVHSRFSPHRLANAIGTLLTDIYYHAHTRGRGEVKYTYEDAVCLGVKAFFNASFLTNATSFLLTLETDVRYHARTFLLGLPSIPPSVINVLVASVTSSASTASRARVLAAASHAPSSPPLAATPDGLIATILGDLAVFRPNLLPIIVDACVSICLHTSVFPALRKVQLRTIAYRLVRMDSIYTRLRDRAAELFCYIVGIVSELEEAEIGEDEAEGEGAVVHTVRPAKKQRTSPADISAIPHVNLCSDIELCAQLQGALSSNAAAANESEEARNSIDEMLGHAARLLSACAVVKPEDIISILRQQYVRLSIARPESQSLEVIQSELSFVLRMVGNGCGNSLQALQLLTQNQGSGPEADACTECVVGSLPSLIDDEIARAFASVSAACDWPKAPSDLKQLVATDKVPGNTLMEAYPPLKQLVTACTSESTFSSPQHPYYGCPAILQARILVVTFLPPADVTALIQACFRDAYSSSLSQLAERLATTPHTRAWVAPDVVGSAFVSNADIVKNRPDLQPQDVVKFVQEVSQSLFTETGKTVFTAEVLRQALATLVETAVVRSRDLEVGPAIPLLFMRCVLMTAQHHPDVKGILVGLLTTLVSNAGEKAFEAPSLIQAWGAPDGNVASAPIWDGFLHVVRRLQPLSFMLLTALPQGPFNVLLSCVRETPLVERFQGWYAVWAQRTSNIPTYIREAMAALKPLPAPPEAAVPSSVGGKGAVPLGDGVTPAAGAGQKRGREDEIETELLID
jgi:hypothetical protein